MAGALGLALGGPRAYPGEIVQESHINASGRKEADVGDILGAIRIYSGACLALWLLVLVLALITLV